MRLESIAAVVALSGFGTPGPVSAQQLSGQATTVTFTMPVKLTQLSPDLERVKFVCKLTSSALAGSLSGTIGWSGIEKLLQPEDEVWVMGGQLVTTMKVMVLLPIEVFKPNPIGQTAEYSCGLMGYSKSLQRWDLLDAAATVPVFNVKPTPQVQGTFVW